MTQQEFNHLNIGDIITVIGGKQKLIIVCIDKPGYYKADICGKENKKPVSIFIASRWHLHEAVLKVCV